MPVGVAKTVWVRKHAFVIAFILFTVVVTGVSLVLPVRKAMHIGNGNYSYEVADTPEAQQQGLSGRQSLRADHAMLFVFPEAGKECFWMKDMKFPIDMIWLNDQKQVVFLKEHATPESYPEQFCPEAPARYVVEVNNGIVEKTGLKLGDQVQF